MKKFKVEPVKDEDGLVIGVRAARVNDRDIIIALYDVPQKMTWKEAVECKIPSLFEWLAISENFEHINKVLEEMGGEYLSGYHWS